MNFDIVSTNARMRLNENLNFLNYIASLEPSSAQESVPVEVNIMKGLFYVHLYSSLEKIFNDLVEQTIILINSKSIQIKHYNPSFLLVSLDSKLKSFKMCNSKNYINKAFTLFLSTHSDDSFTINETTFSDSLQNVWFKTIEEVCLCFGIDLSNTSARVKTTINELVDKRNAVAHGRENAHEIGSRFRVEVIRTKYNEISAFCYQLIEEFNQCIDRKRYLKPSSKRFYD